jgi:uncharacterized membrane protein
MEDRDRLLADLHSRIEEIAKRQKNVQEEIQKLHNDIFQFNLGEVREIKKTAESTSQVTPIKTVAIETPPITEAKKPESKPVTVEVRTIMESPVTPPRKKEKTPIEEFIGTNLLNKIGIAILVIGIGFGAKYSIDHELINPLTRIILGYLAGISLIVIAIQLKAKHKNFSAVLLSGGMAVMYFITFAAYDLYELMPQLMAFLLMVVFTCFTVFAAIQYNLQMIGVIGLVGAYAVPFLLSDGSGRVVILFTYITIINAGILILSFRKDWKILYYTGFALTWLSFAAWFGTSYNETKHVWISLLFTTIFFATFFSMFLSYKLVKKEPFTLADLTIMLINSFVFFTYGYLSIDYHENGDQFLGIFTVFTAIIHFIGCAIIFKKQNQSKDLFYFLAGMVLVFLTIAVPVQLEGNYVTIVWAFEAALLFWIGRMKKYPTYEKISYALIILAFLSLLQDWEENYQYAYYYVTEGIPRQTLFLNIQFLSSVLVIGALLFIYRLSTQERYLSPFPAGTLGNNVFSFGLPAVILFITYMSIFKEIDQFWNFKFAASKVTIRGEYPYDQFDDDINRYRNLWLIYYSAIFSIALSFIQIRFAKNKYLLVTSMAINALTILTFIVVGLYELSGLRFSYLNDQANLYYFRKIDNITIRYFGLALSAVLLLLNFRFIKDKIFSDDLKKVESVLIHLAILILLSSELIHWLDMAAVENSYKLSLSILWGSYALFLVVIGLVKNLKHIRISAMVLFAVTLIKLFIYDMEDMSTIAKTLVMIILGVLMLVSSFLYNKFKKPIENEAQ